MAVTSLIFKCYSKVCIRNLCSRAVQLKHT